MRRRRRRKELAELRLTPEGWVYLVVLAFITVGAVLRNVNLLIFMAGMMYAPLLINWRLGLRRLRSLTASRRIPNQMHANETSSIQWTCQNKLRGMAAWNVVVHDRVERVPESEQTIERTVETLERKRQSWLTRIFGEILSRLGRKTIYPNRSEAKVGFVRVNAEQSEVESYRVYFWQRGKYVVGPASLSTTFPFGLIVCRVFMRKQEDVFVAPQIGQLNPTWEQRVQSIATGSETIKRRRALEDEEFYALRPWRSGDSKKQIHWRTTARMGQPIVKQHDQPNNRDFALILDLYQEEDSDFEACERVLSFSATTVIQMGTAVQGKIAIAVCGEESEVCHSRSQQSVVSAIMPRLAVAKPSEKPELVDSITEVAQLVSTGTPVYVVSSRPRPDYLDTDFSRTRLPKEDLAGEPISEIVARQLRQIAPLLRWLDVNSEEFQGLFSLEPEPAQEKYLNELKSKWTSDAGR